MCALFTTMVLSMAFVCPAMADPAQRHRPIMEPLLEAPFQTVPEGITYEDYRDANRRLGLGFTYAALPGGMHFYADEPTTGWVLVGTAALGITGIIVGSSMRRDIPRATDEYATREIGNKTYYRIPVEEVSGSEVRTSYHLEEAKTTEPGLTDTGGAFLTGGVIALVGAYIWDLYHGIGVIEDKRDRARFKIGQALSRKRAAEKSKPTVQIKPLADPQSGAGGVQVEMKF